MLQKKKNTVYHLHLLKWAFSLSFGDGYYFDIHFIKLQTNSCISENSCVSALDNFSSKQKEDEHQCLFIRQDLAYAVIWLNQNIAQNWLKTQCGPDCSADSLNPPPLAHPHISRPSHFTFGPSSINSPFFCLNPP